MGVFCLARDNGTTRMYANGTLQTATYSGTGLTNGTNRPVMGAGAYAILLCLMATFLIFEWLHP